MKTHISNKNPGETEAELPTLPLTKQKSVIIESVGSIPKSQRGGVLQKRTYDMRINVSAANQYEADQFKEYNPLTTAPKPLPYD
jgi:hypothetical protein